MSLVVVCNMSIENPIFATDNNIRLLRSSSRKFGLLMVLLLKPDASKFEVTTKIGHNN